jgi:predicted nucleic acid-binding protein
MKIYIDTSVIGGCFDVEFEDWSMKLFEKFQSGEMLALVSDLTEQELTFAPEKVQEKLEEVPDSSRLGVSITDEIIRLAESYIREGALSPKSFNDALHIAAATIHNANVLASWNFKHIVNLQRIRLYNSVNLKKGYRLIEIRTPREILESDE